MADAAGQALKQIIDAGKASQAAFLKTGNEINDYAYSDTYQFLYQEWNDNGGGDLFFKAKVAKAAQFVEVVGPYLYQYNPVYNVTSRGFAPQDSIDRHQWEAAYLDWSAQHADQYTACRRGVNQSCIYGRGVLWTGYNMRKRCVQHEFVPVEDTIDDADARTREESNLKIRRRLKPRWEVINMFQDEATRAKVAALKKASDLPSGMKDRTSHNKTELIRYYEVFMRIGLGRYADGAVDETGAIDDTPKLYLVSEEGELLATKDWDIPFYVDDMWPCEELDLRELPGRLYPAAPLSPSLGYLRALNWIHTLYLSKMRTTTRTPLVLFNVNGQKIEMDQVFKILRGDQMDVAMVTVNGNENMKLGDLLQQFKFESGVEEFERFTSIISDEFDRTSGLYQILFAGNTDRQLRSAEDAKMKERNSRSRIDDMRTQVEKWTTKLGQKARFAARYLETSQDIAKRFGPQAGAAWGDLAAPGVAQQQRQMQAQEFGQAMQQLQMQAQQTMQAQQRMGGMPTPPQPEQLKDQAMAMAKQAAPITAVDFEEWMEEADVQIESGSMRRLDRDQQADAIDAAMNTVAPILLQTGFMKSALEIAKAAAVIHDMPDSVSKALDEAIAMAPAGPPPPPGPLGEAPPPAKGQDKKAIPFPGKARSA